MQTYVLAACNPSTRAGSVKKIARNKHKHSFSHQTRALNGLQSHTTMDLLKQAFDNIERTVDAASASVLSTVVESASEFPKPADPAFPTARAAKKINVSTTGEHTKASNTCCRQCTCLFCSSCCRSSMSSRCWSVCMLCSAHHHTAMTLVNYAIQTNGVWSYCLSHSCCQPSQEGTDIMGAV